MTAATHTTDDRLRVSRRGFLKASGVGAAATVAGKLGAVPFSASRAAAQQGWDEEHDIVVVGSGGAGFAAAVTAHHLGSSVAVLEKGSYVGGTTLVSGAGVWIPNNSQMREAGLEDPRDEAIAYMARFSFPAVYNPEDEQFGLSDYDYEMLAAFYDLGPEAMDTIEEAGAIDWVMMENVATGVLQTDYMDHFEENQAPHGRSVQPIDENGVPLGGGGMIEQYMAYAERVDMPVHLNTRVDRIVLNEEGEVIGVEATVTPSGADGVTPDATPSVATPELSETLAIRARKGVIFGSGGFAQNEDMMRHNMPVPYYGGCAAPTNEGDFVRIAASVGAKLGNMHNVWRNEGIVEQALADSGSYNCVFFYNGDSFLMVNKEGRRFVNEKRNYQDRPRAHFDWDANQADWKSRLGFLVYDERINENWGGGFPFPEDPSTAPYVIHGETLEELAAAIDERLEELQPMVGRVALSEDFAETFVAEVETYNEYARSGDDLDFQRGEFLYDQEVPYPPTSENATLTEWPSDDQPSPAMYPLSEEGPYYAIIMGASAVDTNGGPVINTDGQILNVNDGPVVGLYGAGNCIANPGLDAYWGGGATLGNAHVWGYAAARHAHNSEETSV